MKKSFSVFYILLSFIICGCSKNTISTGSKSYTSTSDSIADSSKGITQKYITAKRVYDLEYDADGCLEEALTLDEFPDLTFRRDESKAAFLIEGRETIIDPKQIGAKGSRFHRCGRICPAIASCPGRRGGSQCFAAGDVRELHHQPL